MKEKIIYYNFRTVDEYQRFIFCYTVINSMVFGHDIKEMINERLAPNKNVYNELLGFLEPYLKINSNMNIFDEQIKRNLIDLTEYLLEYSDTLKKIEKNEFLNNMKAFLNNIANDNKKFLINQISMRDYAKEFNIKLNFLNSQVINNFKNTYYSSIQEDIVLAGLLFKDDEYFYDELYKDYLMYGNFYRSLNYFLLKFPIYLSTDNIYNKVKLILEENKKEFLKIDKDDNTYDDLVMVSNFTDKLVKKFEKQYR